jgi:glycosyltransferase involved in cell wall biosynthesis
MGQRGASAARRRWQARRRYDVAFYVPWLSPLLAQGAAIATGGAETQIFLLARLLAQRGLRVCLLVFDRPGLSLPAAFDGVAIRVRAPYRAHERLGKLRETLSLARAVLGADSRVVVSRSAGPDTGLVALFAKLSGRRFVFSSANVSDFDYDRLSPTAANRMLYRVGVRLADAIVVQTSEQERMSKERLGRAAVLIQSIAEPAPPRTQPPEAFLWAGRLVWYKRPLAFVELARRVPEATFWMVGVPVANAPGGEELEAEIRDAADGLPSLVLLGQRSRDELMALVERAVAVVNTADFEGMPNILLEGWARGVPALTLSHDPDGVVEKHSLGGHARGSPEGLAELARSAWAERHDPADVAARCRRYVAEHHAPDVVAARWAGVLSFNDDRAGARRAKPTAE